MTCGLGNRRSIHLSYERCADDPTIGRGGGRVGSGQRSIRLGWWESGGVCLGDIWERLYTRRHHAALAQRNPGQRHRLCPRLGRRPERTRRGPVLLDRAFRCLRDQAPQRRQFRGESPQPQGRLRPHRCLLLRHHARRAQVARPRPLQSRVASLRLHPIPSARRARQRDSTVHRRLRLSDDRGLRPRIG